MTQFVKCAFGDKDTPAYTYANDGVRLEVGQRVLVERYGKSVPVRVVEIDVPAPKFECKPILGLAPAKEGEPATSASA